MRTRVSKEFLEEEYVRKRKSQHEVAKMLGLQQQTIRRHLIHYEIPRRSYEEAGRETCAQSRRKGFGDIRGSYWSRVRIQARQRNLEFDITPQQAWELFLKQNRRCALTGLELRFATTFEELVRGVMTASLDRIDSKKGYTIDNIQWVHKEVNIMKGDLEESHFIEMCKLVAVRKGESN